MEKRNLSQITPQKIGTVLGYTIYVPDCYFNPLSYMKKGCPIWVQTDESGNCLVFDLKKDCDETEITSFIKQNLEPKSGIICVPLSEIVKNNLKLSTNNGFGLNCMAQDCENGNVAAVITVDRKHTDNGEIMFISNIIYDDIQALKKLREYLFREENIIKHRSQILWYQPSNGVDLTDALHFIKDKNGMSFLQFE